MYIKMSCFLQPETLFSVF